MKRITETNISMTPKIELNVEEILDEFMTAPVMFVFEFIKKIIPKTRDIMLKSLMFLFSMLFCGVSMLKIFVIYTLNYISEIYY